MLGLGTTENSRLSFCLMVPPWLGYRTIRCMRIQADILDSYKMAGFEITMVMQFSSRRMQVVVQQSLLAKRDQHA